MQGHNRSQRQDPLASGHAGSATHTHQQWLHWSVNQSVPELVKRQHSNRSLGFSSIRDLARTSRRPLATLPTNSSQSPDHTLKPSTSLYGTLRDQCTPPPPPSPSPLPVTELPGVSQPVLRRSHSFGAESLTPDQGGISTNSNHRTAPSPARHPAFSELPSSNAGKTGSMGNKASAIVRKPLTIKAKRSLARFDDDEEKALDSIDKESSESSNKHLSENIPPATFSARGSSPLLKVPRRRSSLTALHLDSSHFDTLDPKQPKLKHRASSPPSESHHRQPAALTEIKVAAPSGIIPSIPADDGPDQSKTLSPPLLSPTSALSSTSSQPPSSAVPPSLNTPTPTSRNSVIGSRIHLPKTVLVGPPQPVLLRPSQYQCYVHHKRFMESRNTLCPVPCMTCHRNVDEMWICIFCLVRICFQCMSELKKRKNSLESLMVWVKEQEYAREGEEVVPQERGVGSDEKQTENVEKAMEEQALKKVEVARKRETR